MRISISLPQQTLELHDERGTLQSRYSISSAAKSPGSRWSLSSLHLNRLSELELLSFLSSSSDDAIFKVLEKHRDFLPELFIVSHVTLTPASAPLAIGVRPCAELGHVKCPRCWRSVPALTASAHGEVCPRCAAALSGN